MKLRVRERKPPGAPGVLLVVTADGGRFRVTVRAAKYDDGLLLDPGAKPQAESAAGRIAVKGLANPQTIRIPEAGIYQADVHLDAGTPERPDASRLQDGLIGTWQLDGDARGHPTERELTGRLVGAVKFVDSPFGKAVSVDGKTGRVLVAAWIHPRELRQAGIVCLGGYGYTHGWLFDMPKGSRFRRRTTRGGSSTDCFAAIGHRSRRSATS